MIKNTKTLIEFLIQNYIDKDRIAIAIDMTCGNGNDSKFILDFLSPKKLYAFDVQNQAKEATYDLLTKQQVDLSKFHFILDSHEYIDKYVNEEVDLAIYNLGYLPKGDHSVTTDHLTVKKSLEKLLPKLSKNACVFITFYPGHQSGLDEAFQINEFLMSLDQKIYTIIKFDFINQMNKAPFVCMLQKK